MMLSVICDIKFHIFLPNSTACHEYELEYQQENLTQQEGMFACIATITNFMMQHLDNNTILGYLVIIFRRLYNFFPKYRKHLEEPIVIILTNILKTYRQNEQYGSDPRY